MKIYKSTYTALVCVWAMHSFSVVGGKMTPPQDLNIRINQAEMLNNLNASPNQIPSLSRKV